MNTTTNRTDLYKVIGMSGDVISKWNATEADALRWFRLGRSTGGQQLVDGLGRTIAEVERAFVGAR